MPGFIGIIQRTTTERGYGRQAHMVPRRRAFTALPDWSPCCRCQQPMWKWERETLRDGRTRSALHYDHNDARDGYLGFSHRLCNLRAGARRGGQIVTAQRHTIRRWRSRVW